MQLKMRILALNSAAQTKQERNADNTVTTTKQTFTRIAAKDDKNNVLQFTTDYETGKTFALDQELTITVE